VRILSTTVGEYFFADDKLGFLLGRTGVVAVAAAISAAADQQCSHAYLRLVVFIDIIVNPPGVPSKQDTAVGEMLRRRIISMRLQINFFMRLRLLYFCRFIPNSNQQFVKLAIQVPVTVVKTNVATIFSSDYVCVIFYAAPVPQHWPYVMQWYMQKP
jgi:hypothetical protein